MPGYLRYVSSCFLVTVAVLGIIWLIAWKTWGLQFFSVQSDSMKPVMAKGDLILEVRPAVIKPGDIVTYPSQVNPGETVSHRVTAVGKVEIITKGDNLATADPPIAITGVKGRAIVAFPKAGYLFDQLRKPAGLLIAVYIPALIITALELWRITEYFKYRNYRVIKTT
jgi:signal peptidase I